MKAIINANVVMPDHVIPNGVILYEDGVISAVGKARDISVPEDAEIIDAENKYVGPGLIDIHTHAAGGVYFTEDPVSCGRELLKHGVTSVLPALYYSLDQDALLPPLRRSTRHTRRDCSRTSSAITWKDPTSTPALAAIRIKTASALASSARITPPSLKNRKSIRAFGVSLPKGKESRTSCAT